MDQKYVFVIHTRDYYGHCNQKLDLKTISSFSGTVQTLHRYLKVFHVLRYRMRLSKPATIVHVHCNLSHLECLHDLYGNFSGLYLCRNGVILQRS